MANNEAENREKYLVIWYDLDKGKMDMRLFVYLQAAMQFIQEVEAGAPTLYECRPVGIIDREREYAG